MALNDFPFLSDIEPEIWDKLDFPEDESGTPPWARREVVRAFNRAYQHLWGKISDLDKDWGLAIATLAVTAGSRVVDLTSAAPDCRAIREIKEIDASGNETSSWQNAQFSDIGLLDKAWIYQKDQKQLYLTRTPSESTSLRLVYNYVPLPLAHGYVQSAGSTSTELEAHEVSSDSDLVDQVIYIYSGTGAGQSKTITAWDGETKTATHTAWSTVPSTDSRYTTRPLLPIGARDAFLYDVCCYMADKHEDGRLQQFMMEREKHLRNFLNEMVRVERAQEQIVRDPLGYSRFSDPILDDFD